MKQFIKKHILISILLILSIGYILFYCFKYIDNQNNIKALETQWINYCESDNIDDDKIDFCKTYLLSLNEEKIEVDFYTMMADIIVFDIQFLNAIAFLIIIIPTLTDLCKKFKSKDIINLSTRESYKKYLKTFLICAYRYIWLLPVIASTLILMCLFNTTLDPKYTLTYGGIIWNSNIISNPIIFVTLYLLNICLYSFTFINISLIIVRKQHNYIKAIILSFITYIGIQLFFEVIINALIFQQLFNTEIGFLFNIMNLFTFSDNYGTLPLMIFSTIICIISFLGVYLVYKNKESLVIDCEKNN